MKKIFSLLSIVTMCLFISCSNSDNEDYKIPTLVDVPGIAFLSCDSVSKFELSSSSKYLVKSNRSDNTQIWSTPIVFPSPTNVDLGYGESATITFEKHLALIDGNKAICLLTMGVDRFGNSYGCNIGTYNQNGTHLKNCIVMFPYHLKQWQHWYNDKFIFLFYNSTNAEKYKYIIIDSDGSYEREGDTEIFFNSTSQILPKNDQSFFYITNTSLKLADLDNGEETIFDFDEYFKSKYPNETNNIRISITPISVSGNIVTVHANLTFFSGEKKSENIKVDYTRKIVVE